MEPLKPDTTKVTQSGLGLSINSSSPENFPIVYADNVWDIVKEGTDLSNLQGITGSFDQHTLNELFAKLILLNSGDSESYDSGLVPTIVETLPPQGDPSLLYLIQDGDKTGIYKTYVWLGNAYGQTSCGAPSWENLYDKPDLAEPLYWEEL